MYTLCCILTQVIPGMIHDSVPKYKDRFYMDIKSTRFLYFGTSQQYRLDQLLLLLWSSIHMNIYEYLHLLLLNPHSKQQRACTMKQHGHLWRSCCWMSIRATVTRSNAQTSSTHRQTHTAHVHILSLTSSLRRLQLSPPRKSRTQ